MRIASLLLAVALAGCQSVPRQEAVAPERVLSTPYSLRLDVSPKTARPGERVTVIAEFVNTGSGTLWVPRRRELFLGFRQGGAGGGSWSSSCDGILYVRLQPGQSVRYEVSFEVPGVYGQIEIYTSVRRDITVPLTVERWFPPQNERGFSIGLPHSSQTENRANKAPEPTITSVTPRAAHESRQP